jgi:hypothetical protein
MGVGLYFIFVACAGISIIVWVFNWICWLNQCCCCDFLHNPVNKRIAWWMSFIFLLGILSCCIAGCVSVNRFGFALEGARCAVDRIYYDSIYGQLKVDEPKWKGLEKFNELLTNLIEFTSPSYTNYNPLTEEKKKLFDLSDISGGFTSLVTNLNEIHDISLAHLKETEKKYFDTQKSNIKKMKEKNNFIERFYHYENILKDCMQILAMVYFCMFLITVTFAGVSLMFYACLKRQGYLITFMHILWNIIRFFMVSFFIFGTAYGIFDLALTDSIAVIQYLFSQYLNAYMTENYEKEPIVPKSEFLLNCLKEDDYNFLLDNGVVDKIIPVQLRTKIVEFYDINKGILKLLKDPSNEKAKFTKNYFSCNGQDTLCDELSWVDRDILLNRKGDFLETFNCAFLHNDFNILYKALYDAATESEYLAAISLCASFFGAIAVYFYLLVLHHYNNEMFFDSGKSIFKGFDGYGGGFKKKNIQQDPAYKKRKLRAEIELTSKNDEASGYNKDINKNDDEEE